MRRRLFSRGSNAFALTPDPRFAFPSSSYESALDTLRRGLEQKAGLILLTGPAGCGKTMLLRALQDRIARDGGLAFFRAFFPFNPNLRFDPDAAADDLLSSLLAELRHESIVPGRAEREQALGQYIERLPHGVHAVLLLDDAHRFDDSDRDVMLLPQRWRGGLQVILAGREDLVERYHQFLQANDAAARAEPTVVELGPLTPGELASYVAHRLAVAGGQPEAASSPSPFEPAALERVYTYSKGVPRTVNRLCASALAIDPKVVDAAAIDAAALECGLRPPLFPHVGPAAGEVQRRPAQFPHDLAQGRRDAPSSAIERRHVRHRASALAVALGLAAGALYLANVYLGLDGAVATALIRLERPAPAPDHMPVSEALTKPPAEVAPPEAVVAAPSEKPTSAADIKAESHRESLSNDESGLSREAVMGAAEYSGQSPENNDPRSVAPPSSDLTESTGTDSDSSSEPGSLVANDTFDSGETVNSEAQIGTGISVDEGLNGASTGGNLLPSAEESSPASLNDAEPPLAPQDDTVVQSAAAVSPPDRPAPEHGNARAEKAPDSTRSGSPPADFAPSGVPESQVARAPTPLPPPQSAILDAERLLARGYSFFDTGDPASARLFFERAAMQGHAGAMMAVGETFDPLELQRRRIIGVRGEPDRALVWYRRSVEAGDRAASERLTKLSDWISRRPNPN